MIEKEIPRLEVAYTPTERRLGVGVNRTSMAVATADLQPGKAHLYCSEGSVRVWLDFEKDPGFVQLLELVKTSVDEQGGDLLSRVNLAVQEVVWFTPRVDRKNEFHFHSDYYLGYALEHGVQCIDRALAFEAVVKMIGVSEAQLLYGVDLRQNHADLKFFVDGEEHVAVTMGKRAGEVMNMGQYEGEYLSWRVQHGLGKRRLEPNWGRPYFERVGLI